MVLRPVTLLLPLTLAGCQTIQRAEPERTSFREDLFFAPPLADIPQNGEPVEEDIRQAADRGMEWLMATRMKQGAWDGPYPVAIAGLALSSALRDERMEEPAFRSYWEETIRFLIHQQSADGHLSRAGASEQPYEHALAARALCEALSLYSMPGLRETAERAIRLILDRQQTGGGWYYGYSQGRRRSTPLTVVQMDALFAAAEKGLFVDEIRDALERAAQDLMAIQSDASGRFGYLFRGIGQSVINGYALYGLQLAGWGLSLSARGGWRDTAEAVPYWPRTMRWPLFAAYYNHSAAYHLGGTMWQSWRASFYDELLAGQHDEGYWSGPFLEAPFGPPYATALAVLMIRSMDRTPRLVTRYAHVTPGPLYRLQDTHILTSTLAEETDGYLIDAYLMDVIAASDRFIMEGSARAWAHHVSMHFASQTEQDGLPPHHRELREELNRLFSVPATHSRLWDHVPPSAIALLVWGNYSEEADRTYDGLIEYQMRRRLPPGRRMETILSDTYYASAMAQVTHEEGMTLLRHAMDMRTDAPLILDRMADAWCAGDEEEMATWTRRLLGDDPAVQALYDRLLEPARARIVDVVREALASDSRSLIVLPAWHLYGPNGVLARLQESGLTFERVP